MYILVSHYWKKWPATSTLRSRAPPPWGPGPQTAGLLLLRHAFPDDTQEGEEEDEYKLTNRWQVSAQLIFSLLIVTIARK